MCLNSKHNFYSVDVRRYWGRCKTVYWGRCKTVGEGKGVVREKLVQKYSCRWNTDHVDSAMLNSKWNEWEKTEPWSKNKYDRE